MIKKNLSGKKIKGLVFTFNEKWYQIFFIHFEVQTKSLLNEKFEN